MVVMAYEAPSGKFANGAAQSATLIIIRSEWLSLWWGAGCMSNNAIYEGSEFDDGQG
jgi:hypothetical protein